MTPLIGLDREEIRQLLGPGEPAFRARQVYQAIYNQHVTDPGRISTLPSALRRRLADDCTPGLPEIANHFDSSDGTRRYLLRLQDGRTIETVLMPEAGRNTICISTQVGCPVDCKFCLTALLGMERNLTAGEIVGQILLVTQNHELSPTDTRLNVVMMGMGEPLLNLPNVLKASRILFDPEGVGMSPRRVTVSTSGIVHKFAEFASEPLRPKLAISLNASTEEQRQELMPITRKHHLADLLQACRRYPLRPWERLTFEYVLLKGVNDSDADARRVVGMLGGLNCKLNLIAFNPGPEIPFETPDPERVLKFQEIVKRALPCFLRKPRGVDIYAACGQLKRTTEESGLVSLAGS